MRYYAIYTYYGENTFKKSHIALSEDQDAISLELIGNPYKAFENAPEYIEQ